MTASQGVPVTARERGKIAPEKLAHVVLRTANAEPLINWYCTVLEAEIAMANPMISFLTYDDEHHRIAIAQFPGVAPAPPMASGLEHIAFTYRDADALFATYERLKGLGIHPYWTINHGPTLSFYYRDPDNNQVELQIDLYPDAAAANEWFATSDFSINPIGVKFDPENVIRRYRAGEDPATLFKRPVIEPSKVLEQLPSMPQPTATPGAQRQNPVPATGRIDGNWSWNISGPMGQRRGTATFKSRGGELEGQWKGERHDQPIVRGTWKDGRAHWELDIEKPVKGTLVFEVTLVDGELKGTATFGSLAASEVTLLRASPGA